MTARPPHVIISFDMETDLGNWWTTYKGVNHGMPCILETLGRRGVPATFLFTAAAARACPASDGERMDSMTGYMHKRDLPAFFCLYLHPWEFVPTPHELAFGEGRLEVASWLGENSGATHLAALDKLLELLLRDGATFWTMRDFAAAWRDGAVQGAEHEASRISTRR